MMPSSNVLPQKSVRASNQPMATPNGSANTVATIETRSDSSTAIHSSGDRLNTERLNTWALFRLQSSIRGDKNGFSTTDHAPANNLKQLGFCQHPKSVTFENRPGGRLSQECEILRGVRFGAFGHCHRVDDR